MMNIPPILRSVTPPSKMLRVKIEPKE